MTTNTKKRGYVFAKNGAAICMHDTIGRALGQARQWKASDPTARVVVEEHEWNGDRYVRTFRDVPVELPMLVPALTPRDDFDTVAHARNERAFPAEPSSFAFKFYDAHGWPAEVST